MKKIIKGVLYDTDKAELLYTYVSFRKRKLYYRTEKHNYFCVYSNKEIQPMTEDEFKEFIGEVDPYKYIELFGMPEEA
ncbi:MAG: hypothetical protein IKB64_07495 [Paludibacteraceae bacterium]|nr:hypothetical protein [Paludibacteraceae bacterium]